jgi:hypothetical protein
MNGRILFWSITFARAGFLFGFDTIVIFCAEQKFSRCGVWVRDARDSDGLRTSTLSALPVIRKMFAALTRD